MARLVKEKEYAAKKNEIIDAALRFIYAKGYEQMSIQDILDELHISKGALYHYFNSKQAILEALIDRMGDETKINLQSVVDSPDLNATQKLQSFFATFNRLQIEHKDDVVNLLRIWYTDDNAIVRQKVDKAVLKQRKPFLTEIIRQGIKEGVFTTSHLDQAGEIILVLLQGMGSSHATSLLSLEQNRDEQNCIEDIVASHTAFMDAIERVLGTPPNSLLRTDYKAVKLWVIALYPNAGTL